MVQLLSFGTGELRVVTSFEYLDPTLPEAELPLNFAVSQYIPFSLFMLVHVEFLSFPVRRIVNDTATLCLFTQVQKLQLIIILSSWLTLIINRSRAFSYLTDWLNFHSYPFYPTPTPIPFLFTGKHSNSVVYLFICMCPYKIYIVIFCTCILLWYINGIVYSFIYE